MGLRNINQMMPGVGFSMGEAQAIQDQTTSLGALAVPPSGGGQSFNTLGNINVQISSAGINPGSTGNDNVLAVFTIAASAFDVAGRGLQIMSAGSLANNTNTKTLKIILNPTTAVVGSAVSGGTTIASGVFNTTTAAGGWNMTANVFKYGATASNTQIAIHEAAQSGSIVTALVAPSLLTLTESAVVTVAITGNAATTATDIVYNFLELTWSN